MNVLAIARSTSAAEHVSLGEVFSWESRLKKEKGEKRAEPRTYCKYTGQYDGKGRLFKISNYSSFVNLDIFSWPVFWSG
jgi:hypothetical protein